MGAFAKAFLCPANFRPAEVRRALASVNPGAVVQTMKPGKESNEFFLEMLAAQTLLAESSGALLAKKAEVDLLLRFARTTQISTAISRFGSKEGRSFLAVAAGKRKISVPEDLARYELQRKELSAPELERIESAALLDARRA